MPAAAAKSLLWPSSGGKWGDQQASMPRFRRIHAGEQGGSLPPPCTPR
jgi:hypothetical protein